MAGYLPNNQKSVKVIKFEEKQQKINLSPFFIFMGWKHSGFSVHNGVKVAREDEKGREAIAQYQRLFACPHFSYFSFIFRAEKGDRSIIVLTQWCPGIYCLLLFKIPIKELSDNNLYNFSLRQQGVNGSIF